MVVGQEVWYMSATHRDWIPAEARGLRKGKRWCHSEGFRSSGSWGRTIVHEREGERCLPSVVLPTNERRAPVVPRRAPEEPRVNKMESLLKK